jgi:hypothetical protein
MTRTARAALLWAALALAAGAPAARAQTLASPGPLSQPHAQLDGVRNCLQCHEAGKELTGRKCLACHGSLAARIQQGEGYHATVTQRGTRLACATCHGEHNGRPFRLVRWEGGSRERFDHLKAGFRLEGAHARLGCDDCHKPALISATVRNDQSLSVQRSYLGLGTTCTACHVDEHRGRTTGPCTDCHDQTQWKPAPRFDHSRTRFALTGKHRDVRCDQCHEVRHEAATGPGGEVDTMFVDFRTSRPATGGCTGCHTSPHRDATRFGRCEGCHTVDGWFVLPDSLRSNFDHQRTGFALNGAHADTRCESCHLSSTSGSLPPRVQLVRANFLRPLSRQPMAFRRCDDCHAGVHQGEIGAARGDCVVCHNETKFTPAMFTRAAHDSTGFALVGAHVTARCTACHTPLAGAPAGSGRLKFQFADTKCGSCHTDVHRGELKEPRGECSDCHDQVKFAPTRFTQAMHERTSYPLTGAHAAVPCNACHTAAPGAAAGHVKFRFADTGCASCHRDPHNGAFRDRACASCHTTEAWTRIGFDHSATRYPLVGAHLNIRCSACHKRPADDPQGAVRFTGLPLTCSASGCHGTPHGDQFAGRTGGDECTTCHTEERWRPAVKFDHLTDSNWPLDGAHRDVPCASCHKRETPETPVRYRPLPSQCKDCHR